MRIFPSESIYTVDFSHTKGVEKVTNFVGRSPEKFGLYTTVIGNKLACVGFC